MQPNDAHRAVSSRRIPDAVLLTLGCGLLVALGAGLLGLPCPIRVLTGLECPLCGGTRMGQALLDGDVAGAFAANLFVLIIGPIAVYLLLAWSLDRFLGPGSVRRLPAPGAFGAKWLGFAVLAAGLVFMLLRNTL